MNEFGEGSPKAIFPEGQKKQPECRFKVGPMYKYLLGRSSTANRGLETTYASQVVTTCFLEPPLKGDLSHFSREHVLFHTERVDNDDYIVIDAIPARYPRIVYYYRGYNMQGDKILNEPYERGKEVKVQGKYRTRNLSLLMPASKKALLRMDFLGEGEDSVSAGFSLVSDKVEMARFSPVSQPVLAEVPV